MMFNDADTLTYKEIELATEIPDLDLKRCLQSLALVKGRNVLRMEPMCKDVVRTMNLLMTTSVENCIR
jgi:cullin 3